MTKAGERLLKSVSRARAYAKGEADEGFVAHVPNAVDVKAVRKKLATKQIRHPRTQKTRHARA